MISGVAAPAKSSAAFCRSASAGMTGWRVAGESKAASVCSAKVSGGISISVGRGRPVVIWTECFVHTGGDPAGLGDALGPLRDRADDVELVVNVVQQPQVAPDAVAVDLTREQQHGRGAGVGRGEPGRGVVDADAGYDHRHARPAARSRVSVGHVRGGLLVTGHDVADLGNVDERIQRSHQLIAGEAEDDLDALSAELAGKGVAASHRCHLDIVSMLNMNNEKGMCPV